MRPGGERPRAQGCPRIPSLRPGGEESRPRRHRGGPSWTVWSSRERCSASSVAGTTPAGIKDTADSGGQSERELLCPGKATLNEEQQRRKLVPVETVARMCWGSELEGKPRLHPVGRLVLGSDIP
ncbi:hypothetical protein JCM3263A_23210 [Thermobifida fusca]|jgi:hypothetical protein